MTMNWTTNDSATSITPEGDPSWLPLAIALPVCLVGIPLLTVTVIVLITCYRSKFKHKENSIFGRKLNDETSDQNEAIETQNEAVGNGLVETPSSSPSVVYANLSETVEEAKRNEAMMDNSSSNRIGIAKSLHWPLKTPWKSSKLRQTLNTTQNAEAEKDPAPDATSHKEEVEAEEEARMMDEESVMRMERTPVGRAETDIATDRRSQCRPTGNGQATQLDVPVVRNNETTTTKRWNPTTVNKTPMTTKPSPTENRKTFVVMYSMDSSEVGHLSLVVNDVIFFMDEEKDGWMKGEKKESGEIGWFPRTHVREGMSPLVKKHSTKVKTDASSVANDTKTTTTPTTTLISSQQCDNDNDAFEDFDDDDDDDDDYETGIEYKALYPYRATEDGDINFDAGDVIVVVEKQDNGWWRGYHGDDHGFFPGSYVEILGEAEFNQSLVEFSQANGDSCNISSGRAAADVRRSVDPKVLFSVAEEEDVDDDDEALHRKQNKNKTKNVRKSFGDFLMSLPRKISPSSRARSGGAGGPPGSSYVVAQDRDPVKTKKSDRIVIPGVKKKKKSKKTKNDRNFAPMTRRSSLAPAPPQTGRQVAPVDDSFAKSAMFGLAQMVAAEAQLRSDPLNTTYEKIETNDLYTPTRSEVNPSESNKDLLHEYHQPPSSSDVMNEKSSTLAASLLVLGSKRNDVSSSNSKSAEMYSNLDSAAAAAANDSSSSRGQETPRTDEMKRDERERSDRHQPTQVTSADGGPSSTKPVPPQKPNYLGSTPDIAALSNSVELRTARGTARSPGQKPRPLAKPTRPKSGEVRVHDLRLRGAEYIDLRRGLSQLQKPKPLKEKPLYFSRGLAQGVALDSDHRQMTTQRKEICRSLDSIVVAMEAEDGTIGDDEATGELEIIKWLQRKLSAEDELTGGRGGGGNGDGGGFSVTGSGKPLPLMETERTKNNSDGMTRNVESKDGSRIVLKFEGLSKIGVGQESFV